MNDNAKGILLCDCEGTMPLDGKALAAATKSGDLSFHSRLCRGEIEAFHRAAGAGRPLLVCCTQEAPLFSEVAPAALHEAGLSFVNIRENAGWSQQAERATPKIAALIAAAAVEPPAVTTITLTSAGRLLVLGRDDTALEAAAALAERLDVTLVLAPAAELTPPSETRFSIFSGTVKSASGRLGAFEVAFDDYAPALPASRAALGFALPGGQGTFSGDLILDLRGGQPLFPGDDKRDGYVRPDPGSAIAVAQALYGLSDLVGEFEKPRYVTYTPELCLHSRSEKIGCNRCLDACPASAIVPAGELVAIDPYLCAGCGHCASVCPTGAASYALPARVALHGRLANLLTTYRRAGGEAPVLLLHDLRQGRQVIDQSARQGRGLPAHVLPLEVNAVTQIGLDLLILAAAYGAARTVILCPPELGAEAGELEQNIEIANTILDGLGHGHDRLLMVVENDPEILEARLYDLSPGAAMAAANFLPLGGKRDVQRLGLKQLHESAAPTPDIIALPEGAPFGSVEVRVAGCTLCLACVGACPVGALADDPERPRLSFQEERCVQCGLCRSTCPENVVSLVPRLNFAEAAGQAQLIKEEAPFECIRCGKPFAPQSTIASMLDRLSGHAMFAADPAALERLKMCEDCRVIDHMEAPQPMALGQRRVRTTEDYLREREQEGGGSEE